MVHSGVLYISGRRRGPPNVAGPGVGYPLSHPLDGPDYIRNRQTNRWTETTIRTIDALYSIAVARQKLLVWQNYK